MSKKPPSPVKAIRAKCLECSGGSPKEVRECLISDCALYPFRFGKNPARKGIGGKGANFPKNDDSSSDS